MTTHTAHLPRRLLVGFLLTMVLTALPWAASADDTSPDPGGSAPVLLSDPTVLGSPRFGDYTEFTVGNWDGAGTYAWTLLLCEPGASICLQVSSGYGATGFYWPTSTDVGGELRLTVRASNAYGSTEATSAPSAVVGVVTPVTPPAVVDKPRLFGVARVGRTLTVDPGTWTDAATLDGRVLRCGSSGRHCTVVRSGSLDDGQVLALTVTRAAIGSTYRVRVRAANEAGATWATSARTAVVTR